MKLKPAIKYLSLPLLLLCLAVIARPRVETVPVNRFETIYFVRSAWFPDLTVMIIRSTHDPRGIRIDF